METLDSLFDVITHELCVETARLLQNEQEKLQQITWSSGESNLDTEYSSLACSCCTNAWNTIKEKHVNYTNVNISCSIPDINIMFTFPDGSHISKKIELKSSKNIKMPGSTIKKLDINQPLIYCLRPQKENGGYKIRYSQYYNAIGETNFDLFQDRTPRPVINFDKMNDIETNNTSFQYKEKDAWIQHYADCAIYRINNPCQYSWQDDLVKVIKKKIIEDYLKNNTIEQIKEYKSRYK